MAGAKKKGEGIHETGTGMGVQGSAWPEGSAAGRPRSRRSRRNGGHGAERAGFAWGLQMTAKPDTRKVNPPQPRDVVARMAASWLPGGVEGTDTRLLEYHRS
ncbi:hypothetical protein GCM10027091_18380 [Streptomyces daliensis]